jgi:poly [ADP-ribose] polymerase
MGKTKNISKNKDNNNNDTKNKKNNVIPVVKVIDNKAMVDPKMKDRNQYHIYPDKNHDFNGQYFACTLNKSDLSKNNNKYEIIQLLEHDTNGSLVLFLRWGRVGYTRGTSIKPVNSITGPKLFMKKYNDKTKNHSYQEIFIDYEVEVEKKDLKKEDNKSKKKFKSNLSEDVMDLIRLIYDKKIINDNLNEYGYDSKKMPLGKLTSNTLINGLNILKKLEDELNNENPNNENLSKLSSQFYSKIPHNFGFKKMANFIIDSKEKIKEKIDMINSLRDMKITLHMLENADSDEVEYENQEEKQLYDCYKKLNCDIRSISKDEEIYSKLNKYLTAKIKSDDDEEDFYYGEDELSLIKAYEIKRFGESEKFKDYGNKKLLWHGSRITNFVGILSQGLRIAPPEAPSSGYLYGKGVYFADMSKKSSNYCYPVNNEALILLGEVSLGKEDIRYDTDHSLPKTLKEGANSVHALGRLEPSGGENINGDIFVPNGDAKRNNNTSCWGSYAEYIVYNVDQIKLRYLLKIKYN